MEPPLLGDASRPTGGCSCTQLVLTSYPRPVPQRAHWYLFPSPFLQHATCIWGSGAIRHWAIARPERIAGKRYLCCTCGS